MAVQFNLLPDIKIAYDQAQKTQKRVLSIATTVTSIIIAIFIVLFLSVDVVQHKLLSSADGDIVKYSDQLKNIPDLEKILTVQNQLAALPGLHQKKHISSRLFTFLPMLTPPGAGISKLSLDTTTSALSITGTANTVEIVNTFVDTLKFTTFSTTANKNAKSPAFTSVVLASVNRDNKSADYTINANLDPRLLDASQDVILTVPQQLTTQSITNAPTFSGTNSGSTGGQ